jgi:drug/metabolite transporter (DMT)-like permease
VIRDDVLLLTTAAIWGFAFVAQRVGMDHVGPFSFNGVRFALGSASLVPLILVRRARSRGPRGRFGWRGGLAGAGIGLVLFVAASLQQIGLVSTGAGKAGFITGLYVVLVPLSGLFFRQRAGGRRWVGAGLAVAGLFLLSVTEALRVEAGDLLLILGAFFWAAHVQLVGAAARRWDPIGISAIQCAACSLLSLGAAALTETVRGPAILAAALPILYGGLGSVGIAYTLQTVVQRTAHPAHVAILLSLEGVFAAIGGWALLGESFSLRALSGCGLMLAGMLVSQSRTSRPMVSDAAPMEDPESRRERW